MLTKDDRPFVIDPLKHQGLVRNMAKGFTKYGMDFDDLIQEGQIGLLRACREFDPSRGFQFSTVAATYVKNQICNAIRDRNDLIRIPAHQRGFIYQVRNGKMDVESMTNGERECYARAVAAQSKHAMIDDHVLVSPEPEPDNTDDDKHMEIRRRLFLLQDPRLRKIVVLYFGLFGHEPGTLQSVGKELGVTRERIRQLLKKAIGILRDELSTLAA